jgi:conjugative relaxase-like TrwC/TraI family protein
VLRVTTLKAAGPKVARLIDYYAGLAEDQQRHDGLARGSVDYYVDPDEPPGRWWGSGCNAVGLEDEVEPDQLRRMLDARHPHAGQVLGRSFGDASARGFDATFSAPKSVSVLWALSPDRWVRAEVLAAHDAAVTATLGWVEQHGAVTRRGKDGVDQVETRGLVVALFRQHTSRTADPQLHTHAIIWSKVQDPTGWWLALDARWLKCQQRSIGWVYDAALCVELSGRLGVAWEPDVRGQSDIVGIPEPVRQLFSQRSTQVEEKLTELIRRWADDHDGNEPDPRTIARLERYAVTCSRPAKIHQRQVNKLRSEWLERADAAGLVPLTQPVNQPSRPGITTGWDREAVVIEALRRVAAESSTWLPADLAREIATLVPPDAATPEPIWSRSSTSLPRPQQPDASNCTRRRCPASRYGPTVVPSASTSWIANSPPKLSSSRNAGFLPGRDPPCGSRVFRSGTVTRRDSMRRRSRRHALSQGRRRSSL